MTPLFDAPVRDRPSEDGRLADRPQARRGRARIAVVVKGWPRLSETFIAQEVLGLERLGFDLEIWSLRAPTDRFVHPMTRAVRAPVRYLPEYLKDDPARVWRGLRDALRPRPGGRRLAKLLPVFGGDLLRDPTPNRLRRLGQALVMARELEDGVGHLHVHYLHTPASVARYAAILTGRAYSFSAHAKDIWTTPDREARNKIAGAAFGVTCSADGLGRLAALAPSPDAVRLVHHGLDLSRFPAPPARPARDGSDPSDPVRVVTVGRAVAKKGFPDLLDALARLPADLAWRLVHVGSGPMRDELRAQAARLGLAERIEWRGGLPQEEVISALREADVFVLPCRMGEKGDRDGLPNVLMEAASQGLPLLSTRFAGVPEFVREGREGRLVPPGDAPALAQALEALLTAPAERARLGAAAARRVREDFSFDAGLETIAASLDACLDAALGDALPRHEAASSAALSPCVASSSAP